MGISTLEVVHVTYHYVIMLDIAQSFSLYLQVANVISLEIAIPVYHTVWTVSGVPIL